MKLPNPLQLPETRLARARAVLLLAGVCFLAGAPVAQAAVQAPTQASIQQGSAQQGSIDQGSTKQAPTETTEGTLESAATSADNTGRTVAMSLIGLALAIASIVLAFRRDFKEAAGVFVVGIVAVLLATPAGLKLLEDTSTKLFG
jgi:hypothetical protein